jgi:hypothetical protein
MSYHDFAQSTLIDLKNHFESELRNLQKNVEGFTAQEFRNNAKFIINRIAELNVELFSREFCQGAQIGQHKSIEENLPDLFIF